MSQPGISVTVKRRSDRFVYKFGDPTVAPSGWPNLDLNANDTTTKWWRREGDLTIVQSRVVYDNSVTVMQSVAADCHTIKCEIQPNDPGFAQSGGANQRAHVTGITDYYRNYVGEPSWGMIEGETHWYGFAWKTNAAYVPHFDINSGDWNEFFTFHGQSGGQAPINLKMTTIKVAADNREYWLNAPGTMVQVAPLFAVAFSGGNVDDPLWYTKDGQNYFTSRTYPIYDITFVAGRLYKFALKVTWGSKLNGACEVWVDEGQGAGYVRKINAQSICTQWYSGATVDNNMYPIFENYRKADTTLPLSQFYYGGLIRGSDLADVRVP